MLVETQTRLFGKVGFVAALVGVNVGFSPMGDVARTMLNPTYRSWLVSGAELTPNQLSIIL